MGMNPPSEPHKLAEALGKRVLQSYRACGDYPETNEIVGQAALSFLGKYAEEQMDTNGFTVQVHSAPTEHELYPAGYWAVQVPEDDPDYRVNMPPGLYINDESDRGITRPGTISLLGISTTNMSIGMAKALVPALLAAVAAIQRAEGSTE
ncbi:hypothetical protein KHQ84_gp151 [Rhodococcus phage Finch]|uniref:Uncharacterized protein n=1 Tax=Rhodococcus phage Finch TaxID=2094144 RepID=A0A2P1JXW0_9CAUD|nr:hypothetical protein KHQ84_gp151 [Rhodococcus phage Finch]AVO25152.1 hypothetical protein SEA_FINCH_151 [Rhodococcus phage Finch]